MAAIISMRQLSGHSIGVMEAWPARVGSLDEGSVDWVPLTGGNSHPREGYAQDPCSLM